MAFRSVARCPRCSLAMLPHATSYDELEKRLPGWTAQHGGSPECKRLRRRWFGWHLLVAVVGILPITLAWGVLSGWAKAILQDVGVDVGAFWPVSIGLGVLVALGASRFGVPFASRFLEERRPCRDCGEPSTSWARFMDLRLSSPSGAIMWDRACSQHGVDHVTVRPLDAESRLPRP